MSYSRPVTSLIQAAVHQSHRKRRSRGSVAREGHHYLRSSDKQSHAPASECLASRSMRLEASCQRLQPPNFICTTHPPLLTSKCLHLSKRDSLLTQAATLPSWTTSKLQSQIGLFFSPRPLNQVSFKRKESTWHIYNKS